MLSQVHHGQRGYMSLIAEQHDAGKVGEPVDAKGFNPYGLEHGVRVVLVNLLWLQSYVHAPTASLCSHLKSPIESPGSFLGHVTISYESCKRFIRWRYHNLCTSPAIQASHPGFCQTVRGGFHSYTPWIQNP